MGYVYKVGILDESNGLVEGVYADTLGDTDGTAVGGIVLLLLVVLIMVTEVVVTELEGTIAVVRFPWKYSLNDFNSDAKLPLEIL